jgi:hypothetical protein
LSEKILSDEQVRGLLESIDSLVDQGIDLLISFLESSILNHVAKKHVLTAGPRAIPRLYLYLIKQAEKEKDLTSDLSNYFHEKEALTKKYREIVCSPTIPQYLGSNENADALNDCANRIEINSLIFLKRWHFDPNSKSSFSVSSEVPNEEGVEGTVDCLRGLLVQTQTSCLNRLGIKRKW